MSPYVAAGAVVLCIALGWIVGVVAHRRFLGGDDSDTSSGLTDAVAFIGGAFGIILGLLLVFAVQHFADTREKAREEAASSVELFNAVSPFREAEKRDIRRSLICYMRAVVEDDWEASRRADLTGSQTVSVWAERIQRGVDATSLDNETRKSAHYFLMERAIELDGERMLRLQLALPEIPPAIWLVIFVCTFAFITLMTVHLGSRRHLRVVTNTAAGIVLVAIVATLASLDEPYTGSSATVSPIAMESSLILLQDAYPGEDWSPCPDLTAAEP